MIRLLSASARADLGERCTVFIEIRIASLLATGVSRENLAAGAALLAKWESGEKCCTFKGLDFDGWDETSVVIRWNVHDW